MTLGYLRRTVRADFAEPDKVVLCEGLRVVAAAERAMPNELTVAPALRRCDVPDVLIGTFQTERWYRSKLLGHETSLRQPVPGTRQADPRGPSSKGGFMKLGGTDSTARPWPTLLGRLVPRRLAKASLV